MWGCLTTLWTKYCPWKRVKYDKTPLWGLLGLPSFGKMNEIMLHKQKKKSVKMYTKIIEDYYMTSFR